MKFKQSSKVALLALALLTLVPSASRGESLENGQKDRRGFFIGAGLGAGILNLRGDGFSESSAALLSNFRIGGGISEEMQVMYQGGLQSASFNGISFDVYTTEVALNWFFSGNFYTRPAIGVNVATASVNVLGTTVTADSDLGLALDLAAGYEYRLGEMFALSPEVSYKYSQLRSGGSSDHVNSFGAQILGTFYF